MLRRAQPLLGGSRGLSLASQAPRVQLQFQLSPFSSRTSSSLRLASLAPRRATAARPITPLTLHITFSSKPPLQPNTRDTEFEKEVAQKKLEAHPELVSSKSSVRSVVEQSQAPPTADPNFEKDLKSDVNAVIDTFALQTVPKEPFALGLAGTLPYLATSLSTVYLTWDIKTTWPTGSTMLDSFMIPHEEAARYLQLLEPIQVGYGAIIISFLGAIHWGLEYAEKERDDARTRFRYGLGVLAPALAWPTTFMPVEWALSTQFLAFTILYMADTRAATKGWAPTWYGSYRFVLTAVVGVAIVISLIGRTQIDTHHPRLKRAELDDLMGQRAGPNRPHHNWAKEEAEERERIKQEKEKEERRKKQEEREKKREQKNKEQNGGSKGDDGEDSGHKKKQRGEDGEDDSKKDDKKQEG
ncbi:hypothetical protein B0T24DRAFT_561495 [Lasiosphaeria ovina]|uniref:Mitochondrial inner membrane protein 1 n=1 Tax=Lasiosphaeria ovina TaxID=92902 RepID=A0AAE0MZ99_9PEZI|nr:hypothetical protein B0T24DRAFT_561495 [Lasiosphaeria ovina]